MILRLHIARIKAASDAPRASVPDDSCGVAELEDAGAVGLGLSDPVVGLALRDRLIERLLLR